MARVNSRLPGFATVLSGPSSGSSPARFTFFPFTSFLGLFDLKQGSSVISLFALFNKIAGVYGILAVFSGGTIAQVSLYLYSIVSIGALLWGLRGISDEDPRTAMLYSHFFILDHLLSSFWTFYFGYLTFSAPHNGDRPPLAAHQQGLMELIEHLEEEYEIPGKVLHHQQLTGDARIAGAQKVWREERGFAASVLFAGWLLKIFFALILYSYALHLRHGTYASLPLAKSSNINLRAASFERLRPSVGTNGAGSSFPHYEEQEEEEQEDGQELPMRRGDKGSEDWGRADWSPDEVEEKAEQGMQEGASGSQYPAGSALLPTPSLVITAAAGSPDSSVTEASSTKFPQGSLERRVSAGPPLPDSPQVTHFR